MNYYISIALPLILLITFFIALYKITLNTILTNTEKLLWVLVCLCLPFLGLLLYNNIRRR
jgi:Phospholipase_D-nuclease N-terminal